MKPKKEYFWKIPLIIIFFFIMSLFLSSSQLEQDINSATYIYKYPMKTRICEDTHLIKPNIYYYSNYTIMPDVVTTIPPEIIIGFYEPPSKTQITLLNKIMNDTNVCSLSENISLTLNTIINCQELAKNIKNITNNNIMCKVIDGNITLYFFEEVTPAQKDLLTRKIGTIWT